MLERPIKLAYCPTRRDVFSREEAIRYSKLIKESISRYPVEIVDLEGINEEALLFSDADLCKVIDRFKAAKVDAVFFPHCNFGSEGLVAQTAKALGVPVLLWGPRDNAPSESGFRDRDSQCGMFATGKVLRRHNVPFTYIVNSWVDSEEFHGGFLRFLKTVNVVRETKNLRILQISTRPELFCSVICNENELLEKFNVHIYPITLTELEAEVKSVLKEGGEELVKTAEIIRKADSCGGTDEQIMKIAAVKTAMKNKAKAYGCATVAIQCWNSFEDIFGVMPCLANALLTDEGIPVVCETDIHGAITAIMMKAAAFGDGVPFFADITVRHPENDNAGLLWHCGNFPFSLAKDPSKASAGKNLYNNGFYGISECELKQGDLTVARFDGDHGNYSLLIGEAHTTTGPKNVGSYVWIETSDWGKWEHKLVEGPYIHHVAGVFGKVGEILLEACKYIPGLTPDIVDPSEDELRKRLV